MKEREAITKLYNSKNWADKVKKMPDNQVIAIYMKYRKDGKIK